MGAEIDSPWPADALEVGRIVGAWGVKGWVKVQPFSSDPQALGSSRRWFIKPPENALPERAGAARRYPASLSIGEIRRHGDGVVALPVGFADRGAAESLRGARVFIARSNFPAAGADEYYWVDLIGLEVRNRQGERLGTVVGLIDTGPHSVLRVRPEGSDAASELSEQIDAMDQPSEQTDTAGQPPRQAAAADQRLERLIPFVAAYVDDVNLEQRLITVDWGLDF